MLKPEMASRAKRVFSKQDITCGDKKRDYGRGLYMTRRNRNLGRDVMRVRAKLRLFSHSRWTPLFFQPPFVVFSVILTRS
jgi:hypothetical protein